MSCELPARRCLPDEDDVCEGDAPQVDHDNPRMQVHCSQQLFEKVKTGLAAPVSVDRRRVEAGAALRAVGTHATQVSFDPGHAR